MSRLGVLEGENQCMFKISRWGRGGGGVTERKTPKLFGLWVASNRTDTWHSKTLGRNPGKDYIILLPHEGWRQN